MVKVWRYKQKRCLHKGRQRQKAMKMENEIRSVTDGVVKEVFVEDGMKVGLNDRIMVIE